MLTGSYRKRLDADLVRWVGDGLVSAESAAAIRRSLEQEGGPRLPALLSLFGGLMIAASVSAFVAANWEEMPRLMRLALIMAGVIGALAIAWRQQGSGRGGEAAATVAVLIFGAGVALVGQMYHLPADWPAGALVVALGGLAVALLLRSDGALIVGLVAAATWSFGRWEDARGAPHLAFLLLFVPMLWIALGRSNRAVHHLVVLAGAGWLATLPGIWFEGRFEYALIAYGLALATIFVAIGAAALDRGGPPLATACLPWGVLGLVAMLSLELVRILEAESVRAGSAMALNYVAHVVAGLCVAALAVLGRDRRFSLALALALILSLLVPLAFWSGGVATLPGKAAVAALILIVAIALVAAGTAGGVRRLTLAGCALFGLAILILLGRTIGTLLDQSLFFLVAGAVLIGLAGSARRFLARFSRAGAAP